MRIMLSGLGTTGSFIARQLRAPEVREVRIFDISSKRIDMVADAMDTALSVTAGPPDPEWKADVTILAGPTGTHTAAAKRLVEAGGNVVSLSDDLVEVTALLGLDDLAVERGVSVVLGAGFVPGLSCLLARWAADQFDTVDSISVATAGTAGPSCARQHHLALKSLGRDWVEGNWEIRRGGSGRELVWFPEPFGARDCYRGALASPVLLQRQYPQASRISARIAASRRDRLSSRLPMLRPPHEDGGPGGLRVEVRGVVGDAIESIVVGVMDYPSVAGAAVASSTARSVARGRAPVGAGGLVSWSDSGHLLAELRRMGIRPALFSGAN